jgi:2-phospho-L-lactate guanylyltransferase
MKPFAIVPVKELDKCKSRLSEHLSSEDRRGLLLAMLEDVLSALSFPAVVISPEDLSSQLRPWHEVHFLLQTEGRDLDNAVKQANAYALNKGAVSTLFVPADMPLITRGEVEKILAQGERHNAVITHASDGGTGILYRRPPDVIESRFTKTSFEDHLKEAKEKGIDMYVHDSPPLSFDIDTLDDLKSFMKLGKGTKTFRFLNSGGLNRIR